MFCHSMCLHNKSHILQGLRAYPKLRQVSFLNYFVIAQVYFKHRSLIKKNTRVIIYLSNILKDLFQVGAHPNCSIHICDKTSSTYLYTQCRNVHLKMPINQLFYYILLAYNYRIHIYRRGYFATNKSIPKGEQVNKNAIIRQV